jgi:LysM repeat protein
VTGDYQTLTKSGVAQPLTKVLTFYAWFDSPKIWAVDNNYNTSNFSDVWYSLYNQNAQGNLWSVSINDGTPRTLTYVTNIAGEIVDSINSKGPVSLYYFFDGTEEGVDTNDGTQNATYAQSIAQQTTAPGSGFFVNGSTSASPYAAFGTQLESVNGFGNQTQTSPSYTVEAGDTLFSIAQELWGDSSFWYVLADANGLSADSQLFAGETLTVPTVVGPSQNNATTNTVYNETQALGNTSPTHPKPLPPHASGCGVFGEVLEAVVAIVIAAVTYGALSGPATEFAADSLGFDAGFGADEVGDLVAGTTVMAGSDAAVAGGILAGAASGIAASVVSQGMGLATGIQNSFSWAGVAEGALGGAIGGALSAEGAFASTGAFGAAVLQGATGSVLSQSVGLATGLQKSFNFLDVATAGIEAGGTTAILQALVQPSEDDTDTIEDVTVTGQKQNMPSLDAAYTGGTAAASGGQGGGDAPIETVVVTGTRTGQATNAAPTLPPGYTLMSPDGVVDGVSSYSWTTKVAKTDMSGQVQTSDGNIEVTSQDGPIVVFETTSSDQFARSQYVDSNGNLRDSFYDVTTDTYIGDTYANAGQGAVDLNDGVSTVFYPQVTTEPNLVVDMQNFTPDRAALAYSVAMDIGGLYLKPELVLGGAVIGGGVNMGLSAWRGDSVDQILSNGATGAFKGATTTSGGVVFGQGSKAIHAAAEGYGALIGSLATGSNLPTAIETGTLAFGVDWAFQEAVSPVVADDLTASLVAGVSKSTLKNILGGSVQGYINPNSDNKIETVVVHGNK